MKNLVNVLAIGLVGLSIVSCRNNDVPEDIHEHDDPNKVVLTVSEEGTNNVQTVNYVVGSGADKGITLQAGKIYDAKIQFYNISNGVTTDMTHEIVEEKDEHFIVYQFAGISNSITRTSADVVRKDGNKIGLYTQWNITASAPASKGVIKLIHQPATVDDKANDGAGSFTGGETDVNIEFSIN